MHNDTHAMNILALDTSTEACSLALWRKGHIREWHERIPRQHADQILGRLQNLLADSGCRLHELDAIAFGRGPGSFTGLRIATGVAQGLAYGLNIPLVPVSTLETLARQAYEQTAASRVLASLDARIDEIYWAAYEISDSGEIRSLNEEQLMPPEAMDLGGIDQVRKGIPWYGIGNGWSYRERFPESVLRETAQVDHDALPRAAAMLPLALKALEAGHVIKAADAAPVYLRDQVTLADRTGVT